MIAAKIVPTAEFARTPDDVQYAWPFKEAQACTAATFSRPRDTPRDRIGVRTKLVRRRFAADTLNTLALRCMNRVASSENLSVTITGSKTFGSGKLPIPSSLMSFALTYPTQA